MRWNDLLARVLSSARPTFKRFWVSICFTVALTTTLIMSTPNQFSGSTQVLNRLSLAFAAGLLASWCAVLFYERRLWERKQTGSELTGNLAALLSGGLVAAVTYPMLQEFTLVSMSRHAAICIFLFLAFFVIPCFRREDRLEMYAVRLFTQAVLAALFSAVAFIGLSSITFTVSSLFTLKLSYQIYLHIWMVMAGVLAPFLLMAGIPAAGDPVENEDYPKTLKNLVVYVVTPLLTAYTLVLFVYFAKILITRQWPVGLVAHLVLWYSLVTIAILYFVWPLSPTNKWADMFSRYFPRAVIPLLAMMFLSIGIRIRYYGITENRYYVTVVGAWVLGSVLYLNLTKKRRSVILPASLAIVVALSVFGPWSSFSVSKWSQNRRLESLLTKYNMVADNSIVPSSQAVTQTDRQEMAEVLFYFDRFHNLSDVRLLPAGFTMAQFENTFGFNYADAKYPAKPRPQVYYEAANQALDISGYRYLFDYTKINYGEPSAVTLTQGNVQTSYNRESQLISVKLGGNLEWEQSLTDYVKGLTAKYAQEDRVQLLPEDMVLEAVGANLRVRVVITGLWGEEDPLTDKINLGQVGFYVLVGDK